MGLAASQARLLFITARKSDVEYSQMKIAGNKILLARQTEDISDDYNRSLNMRKLVFATDSNATGSNTTDLTYALMMAPNAYNTTSQYLITDINNRVVLSSDYVSKLGLSGDGGNLGSMDRNGFLLAFGLDGTKFTDNYKNTGTTGTGTSSGTTTAATNPVSGIDDSKGFISYIEEQMAKVATKKYTSNHLAQAGHYWDGGQKNGIYDAMVPALKNIGSALITQASVLNTKINSIKGNDLGGKTAADPKNQAQLDLWLKEYNSITKMTTDIKNAITALDNFKAGKKDDGEEWFAVANDILFGVSVKSTVKGAKDETDAHKKEVDLGYSHGEGDAYGDNVAKVITDLTSGYAANKPIDAGKSDDKKVTPGSTDSVTDQNKADFFTNLYYAIRNNGWSKDENVTNPTYLSNQIINGNFSLKKLNSNGTWSESSLSDPSSPVRNVRDNEGVDAAKAKYELEKDRINDKDSLLDIQMKQLETERSALDTEVDSVKSIIQKNIERSFKTFA